MDWWQQNAPQTLRNICASLVASIKQEMPGALNALVLVVSKLSIVQRWSDIPRYIYICILYIIHISIRISTLSHAFVFLGHMTDFLGIIQLVTTVTTSR